jgi:redox-sensitive bicupin YhaK (pirin superfamily)
MTRTFVILCLLLGLNVVLSFQSKVTFRRDGLLYKNGGATCAMNSFCLLVQSVRHEESDSQQSPQKNLIQNPIEGSSEQFLQERTRYRRVSRIEKFARLPVWPVWNGVLIWLVGSLFGNDAAARLEHSITGRVCPNFYNYVETSPFIMLVHHCHSFSALDPLRYIQRTFFPEGFPAHPHRGFVTITYILHGGFIHRDSEGIYQTYGSLPLQESKEPDRYSGKHTQWLTTGKGMLHEEMFDIVAGIEYGQMNSRQELYQIWLNVPSYHKMDEPRSVLLGGSMDTPVVYSDGRKAKTLILAGTYNGKTSTAPIVTDMALFHVTLEPRATWTFKLPSPAYETVFVYVRQGTLYCSGSSNSGNRNEEMQISTHHTAYFERVNGDIVSVFAGADVADFMFLAGVPIKEPCYASGSMVMNFPSEIDQAYEDYQRGLFGIPWDHKLSNAAWREHVSRTKVRPR